MQRGKIEVAREAADPSMILFGDKYYIFASMTLSVWCSEDLVHWESHRLPDNLPLYDYAPDVRVVGDYVYFSASKRDEVSHFYRTKDIINGSYEEIEGTFSFWDPNLFQDDDGRIYFYWGCTNTEPIWGVELDAQTMRPIGQKKGLIFGEADAKGYERVGEDHSLSPLTKQEIEVKYHEYLAARHMKEEEIPPEYRPLIKSMQSNQPYIEGAWMDKFRGKYYLQYACPGTQYNGYADGVYVSGQPLGPFTLADNNPFSYKPGGFIPGAGHGSTMADRYGNLWHTSTMRISVNHQFERRVGLWPAGLDEDGELFCNQQYGDWPMKVKQREMNPWSDPEWYLLSYQKPVSASSAEEGREPEKAVDENVQTWWQAAAGRPGEWLMLDLEKVCKVHAAQINFADDNIDIPVPGEIRGTTQARYIDEAHHVTRWILEGSVDGNDFFILEDKSKADTDLPHDLVVKEEGVNLRYLKLTVLEVPYQQKPCISGLRVFGISEGSKPAAPEFDAKRINDLDMEVSIKSTGAVGYNILWGHASDKLYHSYMVFDTKKVIKALVKGQEYFVRVDAFNEAGITKGGVKKAIVGRCL